MKPFSFGRPTIFFKEQPSLDVRWSLVAQAISENELFLSKNVGSLAKWLTA